jgi:hypothetical protein
MRTKRCPTASRATKTRTDARTSPFSDLSSLVPHSLLMRRRRLLLWLPPTAPAAAARRPSSVEQRLHRRMAEIASPWRRLHPGGACCILAAADTSSWRSCIVAGGGSIVAGRRLHLSQNVILTACDSPLLRTLHICSACLIFAAEASSSRAAISASRS